MNKYLKEVSELISEKRRDDYGDIKNSMIETSNIFYVLTEIRLSIDECILFMVSHKLAREKFKPKKDNIIDVLGYLTLYLEYMENENERINSEVYFKND